MAEVQTVRQAPAEFIEAGGKTYLDDLTKAIGGFKGQDLSQIMGQQYVAGPGALTTSNCASRWTRFICTLLTNCCRFIWTKCI